MSKEDSISSRKNIEFAVQKNRGGVTPEGLNHPFPPSHGPEVENEKKPVHHHAVRNTIAVIASAATIATAGVAIDQGNKNGWFKGLFAKTSSSESSGSSSQSNSEFISSLESSMESESESVSESSSQSSSVSSSSESKSEVKPTPTSTPEELAMQEKLALAPDVEGTVKVIKELNGLKRVVYEAVAGNRFGLEAGSYAGEYKKEVKLEGKETGAISLVPKICETLLKEAVAKTETGYLLPITVDFADLTTLSEANLTFGNRPFGMGPKGMDISFSSKETVDVLNPIPGETVIIEAIYPINNYTSFASDLNINTSAAGSIVKEKRMEFVTVFAKDENTTNPMADSGQTSGFGGEFCKTSDLVFVVGNDLYGSEFPENTIDDVFKINGVPVGITNNKY